MLIKIGRSVVDGIAKAGLGALETLFPPHLIKLLYRDGRTWIQHGRLSLMMVPAECYAGAYGVPMGHSFAAMVITEGKPVMMAATTDKIPALSSLDRQELIDAVLAELEKVRDPEAEAIAAAGANAAPLSAEALARAAAAMEDAQASVRSQLSDLVRKTAYDEFCRLTQNGARPAPYELGNAVHTAMDKRAPALLASAAPGAECAGNQSMKTVPGSAGRRPSRIRRGPTSTRSPPAGRSSSPTPSRGSHHRRRCRSPWPRPREASRSG